MAVNEALLESGIENPSVGAITSQNRVVLFIDDDAPRVADAVAAVADVIELDAVCVVDQEEPPASPFAPGDGLLAIVEPAADGSYPPDTEVVCGFSSDGFPLSSLRPLRPVEDAAPELGQALDAFVDSPEFSVWPREGWSVLSIDDESAFVVAFDDTSMSTARFELTRAGWRWSRGAVGEPCEIRVQLPDGLGPVEWELDPARSAPDAASTTVHVLATETDCSSGRAMGNQLLGPQVLETDDAVLIAFGVIPVTGDADCQGNPSTRVAVELSAPLGDRMLLDGLSIGQITDVATGG